MKQAWSDSIVRCGAARIALVLLAIAMTGCTTTPSMTYDPAAQATATLPLKYSGIQDGRVSFARQFQAELVKVSDRPLDEFLHLPPGWSDSAPANTAVMPEMAGTGVLIAPGLFGECVDVQALPFTDGQVRDRSMVYTSAYETLQRSLGAHSVAAIPLAGRGGSDTNGERVAQALVRLQNDPAVRSIIVVSYSKGTADTLHAFAQLMRDGQMPSKPLALVSVAGAVMGSPIADRYAHLYASLQSLIALDACLGSQGADLASITRQYRRQWLAQIEWPVQVPMYSVVAHAPRELIAPALLPFHDLLALVDPRNDGQIVASDAVLPRSTLLADMRSDHWDLAIPLSASRNPLIRSITTQRPFPRDALFLALVRHVARDLAHRPGMTNRD